MIFREYHIFYFFRSRRLHIVHVKASCALSQLTRIVYLLGRMSLLHCSPGLDRIEGRIFLGCILLRNPKVCQVPQYTRWLKMKDYRIANTRWEGVFWESSRQSIVVLLGTNFHCRSSCAVSWNVHYWRGHRKIKLWSKIFQEAEKRLETRAKNID